MARGRGDSGVRGKRLRCSHRSSGTCLFTFVWKRAAGDAPRSLGALGSGLAHQSRCHPRDGGFLTLPARPAGGYRHPALNAVGDGAGRSCRLRAHIIPRRTADVRPLAEGGVKSGCSRNVMPRRHPRRADRDRRGAGGERGESPRPSRPHDAQGTTRGSKCRRRNAIPRESGGETAAETAAPVGSVTDASARTHPTTPNTLGMRMGPADAILPATIPVAAAPGRRHRSPLRYGRKSKSPATGANGSYGRSPTSPARRTNHPTRTKLTPPLHHTTPQTQLIPTRIGRTHAIGPALSALPLRRKPAACV